MIDHETRAAAAKVVASWVLTIGSMSLHDVATLLAITFTAIQIYVTLRDRVFRRAPAPAPVVCVA